MPEIKHHAFLFDATRCIDCRACMVACSVENNIPMNKTRIWVSGVGVNGEYPEPGARLDGVSLYALSNIRIVFRPARWEPSKNAPMARWFTTPRNALAAGIA